MVNIIPPTERIHREYAEERDSFMRRPFLYTFGTILNVLTTGREPKFSRLLREAKHATYVDIAQTFMINVTPPRGE